MPSGVYPRERKPEDVKDIWDKEVLQLVKLSRETRLFAGKQSEKLAEESEGITNIKIRLEVARTAVQLVDTLGKISKLMMEQLDKGPAEAEEKFDINSLLREQE